MKFGDLKIHLLPKSNYLDERGVDLADVFSTPKLIPTLWGGDPPREPFDRDEFLNDLRDRNYFRRFFLRALSPKWSGAYGNAMIRCQFKSTVAKKWWPELFEWSDRLAEVCQPEFGACHPTLISDNCIHNNWCVAVNYDQLRQAGPPWLGARSYLGSRLVKAIGMKALQSCGAAHIIETDWGVKIDLFESPSSIESSELNLRQASVMSHLDSAGIFGSYGPTSIDIHPGRKWKKTIVPKM